jgi:hypothetical protein
MKPVQSVQSYALPYRFPDGSVWAAIRNGVVMNMVYMDRRPADLEFQAFRQQSRAALAREGVVWAGKVLGGKFVPAYETSDVRHKANCNTARKAHT